jgi:hypothetical protein
MLGLGWQELVIVVLAIVLIAIGKLGGNGTSSFVEMADRVLKRTGTEERGSTTL